jgi:hypothetical protein
MLLAHCQTVSHLDAGVGRKLMPNAAIDDHGRRQSQCLQARAGTGRPRSSRNGRLACVNSVDEARADQLYCYRQTHCDSGYTEQSDAEDVVQKTYRQASLLASRDRTGIQRVSQDG